MSRSQWSAEVREGDQVQGEGPRGTHGRCRLEKPGRASPLSSHQAHSRHVTDVAMRKSETEGHEKGAGGSLVGAQHRGASLSLTKVQN